MDKDNITALHKVKDYDTIKCIAYNSDNDKYSYFIKSVGEDQKWEQKHHGDIKIYDLITTIDVSDTTDIEKKFVEWLQGKNHNMRIDRLSSEEIEIFDLNEYESYALKYEIQ